MLIQLSTIQARVMGVLMEKEITTPEQYPLSLNALTLGCNQKSNREPVMQLSESEVQNSLDELRDKNVTFEHRASGSRVVKYKHRFCNTEFSNLKFSPQQFAIVCVLLLRGPQTPGELRTRTQRLADFSSVDEVEANLTEMQNFHAERLVVKLPREAGKRESRYAHLFSGEVTAADPLHHTSEETSLLANNQKISESITNKDALLQALARIDSLEKQQTELMEQIDHIQKSLGLSQ